MFDICKPTQMPLQRLFVALILAVFTVQVSGTEVRYENVDKFIDQLAPHAERYPVTFDSKAQREEFTNELKKILGAMDIKMPRLQDDADELFRYAFLNAMGHNMDLPGCAEKSISAYLRLLNLNPNDKRANYYFGSFLAATTLYERSVPYLEKAIELGEGDAHYTLAFVFLKEKKQDAALPEFKKYLELDPTNDTAKEMVDDIENKKLNVDLYLTPIKHE